MDCLAVTHDQVEAMTLADRIVVLDFGKIAQVGSPRELYERPANLFVAQFIGSPRMNIVPSTAVNGIRLPENATKVGVRPEHIELVNPGAGLIDGTVDVLEYLGADTFVILKCEDAGQITVRVNGNSTLRPGDSVGLRISNDLFHTFNSDGLAIH